MSIECRVYVTSEGATYANLVPLRYSYEILSEHRYPLCFLLSTSTSSQGVSHTHTPGEKEKDTKETIVIFNICEFDLTTLLFFQDIGIMLKLIRAVLILASSVFFNDGFAYVH